MTRSATVSRTTNETDIQLSLELDGRGEGQRDTGVGFFDHLLDAVARHGLLDLDVRVDGDLETGPHHTVEDTGIALGRELTLERRERAAGDVDGRRRARVVHRHDGVAEAADAGAVAERLVEGLAERQAGVLDGVVRTGLEVALDLDVEVQAAVARHRVEQVVEEADAGAALAGSCPVQGQGE